VASQLARRWILQTLLCQAPAILAHSLQLAVAISLSEAQANLVQTRPSIAGRSAFRWRPPTASRRVRVHQFRTRRERAAPVDKSHATLTLISRYSVEDSSAGAASINIARFFHLLVLVRGRHSSIEFQLCALERSNGLIDVRVSETASVLQVFVHYDRECEVKLSRISRFVATHNGVPAFFFYVRHTG
jgi:phage-related protein